LATFGFTFPAVTSVGNFRELGAVGLDRVAHGANALLPGLILERIRQRRDKHATALEQSPGLLPRLAVNQSNTMSRSVA
jgi:hypothetical protein